MLALLDSRAVEGADRVEAGGLCIVEVLPRLLHSLLHQRDQTVACVMQGVVPPVPVEVVGARGRLRHQSDETPVMH